MVCSSGLVYVDKKWIPKTEEEETGGRKSKKDRSEKSGESGAGALRVAVL
jgi:hypothetical protein